MEILWWWAPAVLVTLLSIGWVSWYGRDGRGEVDRDEAVRRMAEALTKPGSAPPVRTARPRDRSTGIAVRPARTGTDSAPEPTTTATWSSGPEGA